jgi:NodT family efflux transporter outer membrane factor (OMF) lipoprotein
MIRTAIAIILLLLSGGCSVGPDFFRPEPPAVNSYTAESLPPATTEADGISQRFVPGQEIAEDWWLLFQCRDLNEVINQALASNQDLQAARARLRQSQSLLQAGYGVFWPQIDGSLDFSRQRFSGVRFGGRSDSSIFNLYSASLAATYNLDLFGRSRRQVEGQAAQVDLQKAQVRTTYLTLVGNVVNTIIARAAYHDQIEATRQIIDSEQRQLAIGEAKLRAGIVARTEVLSLRTQLAATMATLPPLIQNLEHTGHLLATLSGRPTSQAPGITIALDDLTLPPELPVSLPSDLVRQRPDILAAEAALHSASVDIGVATADLYPSINLSAGLGQEGSTGGDLFTSASTIWDLGGALSQPLFHGRSLRFRRQAAKEAYDAALADYHQTVFTAFLQVADGLRALIHDAQTLQARITALESAEKNLELVRDNYKAGIASYLEVLNANQQYQQARIGHIQARAQRLQDTVVLYAAMGGGWWNVAEDTAGENKEDDLPSQGSQ